MDSQTCRIVRAMETKILDVSTQALNMTSLTVPCGESFLAITSSYDNPLLSTMTSLSLESKFAELLSEPIPFSFAPNYENFKGLELWSRSLANFMGLCPYLLQLLAMIRRRRSNQNNHICNFTTLSSIWQLNECTALNFVIGFDIWFVDRFKRFLNSWLNASTDGSMILTRLAMCACK
jgi:hypothetical protein